MLHLILPQLCNISIITIPILFFSFFLIDHILSRLKFLGQRLNLSCSRDLCHSCSNTRSFNPLHQAQGWNLWLSRDWSHYSLILNPLCYDRNSITISLLQTKRMLREINFCQSQDSNSIILTCRTQATHFFDIASGLYHSHSNAISELRL